VKGDEKRIKFDAHELAASVLNHINAYLEKNGLREWEINVNEGRILRNKKELWHWKDTVEVDKRNEFSFEFDVNTQSVVSCVNFTGKHLITQIGNKFIEFDDILKQKWNSELAIKIATGFVECCLGKIPDNVGQAKVEFHQTLGTYNKETQKVRYRVPYWWISFPRVDKNGYEFQMEYIDVEIYEDFGPTSIFVKMPSRYTLIDKKPLKQEQVVEKAVVYAYKLMKSKSVGGLFYGGKINEVPASAKLEIVKSNHLADLRDLPSSKDIDLNARLAWVFWFEWTKDDPHDSRKNGGIAVWIDAHTGKPLGGDGF
jgi:hypothetical protein